MVASEIASATAAAENPSASAAATISAASLGLALKIAWLVLSIQALIDSSKTDRYGGFIRARTMLLASCTMTSVALYGIFWLGIVALPVKVSQPILSAALFFTTIGALVGLFQLLYAESQSETAVDDYGLSVARLIVAPQLAALAALVGVVLTSLATSTLGGSPTAPVPAPTTIAAALDQIRNPANVLVAVLLAFVFVCCLTLLRVSLVK